MLWLYVTREGRVRETRLQESSGYGALDAAAETVAGWMRFTPALNRDRRTAVWVQQAVEFSVR